MISKKERKNRIADIFLVVSPVLFFMAVLMNYFTKALFSEKVFMWVAGFLLIITIITFIIKSLGKKR